MVILSCQIAPTPIAELLIDSDSLGASRSFKNTYEDFADVRGQEQAKRAIEAAVAGGHILLMLGSI